MNGWTAIREPNSSFANARAFLQRAYTEATVLIVGAEHWSPNEDRFRDLIDAELVRLVERADELKKAPLQITAAPPSDAIPRHKVQAIVDKFADGELATGAMSQELAGLLDNSPPVGGSPMPEVNRDELDKVRNFAREGGKPAEPPKRSFMRSGG